MGFRPLSDHWTDRRTRELRSVQLVEVSVVHALPAYGGTSVMARAKGVDIVEALSPAPVAG